MRRIVCMALSGLLLATAQEPSGPTITISTLRVVAPTTVRDREGFVSGLTARDFRLFDNDKPQDIQVDVAFQPISLVVAVQANAAADTVLPKIRKIGPLLANLVVGDQGEVAVMCFDHRIQVLQDFTSDGKKIEDALGKIKQGSNSSRMVDAVGDSVRMLSHRPKDHRRILLLISETRDGGSEGKMRNTLLETEVNNVLVYTINMNRLLNTINAKTPVPRPDPIPASAHNTPAGGAATPNSIMQNSGWGANTVPMFVEIFRDVKAIFIDNPAELLTKYTGGTEYSFATQHNLEDAVSKIGEELHSQYLINYSPNNKLEGGWHHIRVTVLERSATVKTRTGYWLAAVRE
jgi:VWFA-related protein